MSTRAWTIEELVELVRGTTVVARDPRAQTVRIPSELTEVAEPDARPWNAQLSDEHRADLGRAVETWWRAVAEPGVVHRTQARRREGDDWFHHEIAHLNLTHQPEFGFVLSFVRRLGPAHDLDVDTADEGAVFAAPATIVQHLDEVGIVLRTEGDVEHVFGVPASELEGSSIVDMLHPDDRNAGVAMWMELLSSPDTTRTIQQRIVRPGGSICWIQSTVMNRLATSSSILSVSHDIGAQREQQLALAASEAELRFLTEEVPVGVFRSDSAGAITLANARFQELLPGARHVDDIAGALVDEDAFRSAWTEAASGGSTMVVGPLAPGSTHIELRLRGVLDAPGRAGVIGTADDVTDDVSRSARLEERARRDPLTGLANRRGVEDALRAGAGRRRQMVVFADLDGFKAVNDRFGHETGDKVLRAIGERLRDAVRPDDVVGRWGGDEFVIVCNDVPSEREDQVLGRIASAFREPIEAQGRTHEVAVSLGTAWTELGEDASNVLRRADEAMYAAKQRRDASVDE